MGTPDNATPPPAAPANDQRSARPTRPTRPTRFTVMAAFHFAFAAIALLWTVALVVLTSFASVAGSSAAGVATVTTVAALNGAKVPVLVTAAIGLLRSTRWGFYGTLCYGLLAVAEAFILLSTRASLLLVAASLIYPVIVLVLITAPISRRACGVR